LKTIRENAIILIRSTHSADAEPLSPFASQYSEVAALTFTHLQQRDGRWWAPISSGESRRLRQRCWLGRESRMAAHQAVRRISRHPETTSDPFRQV